MFETLLIILAFAFYSLFSNAISKTVLTLPLLFTVVGFALSGPLEASVSPKVIHEGKSCWQR